ncbi:MAG: hypothetical protein COA42_19410 [Alteromonadaceae bacterium]|nr:MAG: hypothetical protein COA42_19410 [Alteromonadaceae bacterium]
MIVKDFNKQRILTVNEVANLVKKLPKSHFRGIQSILYKPAIELRAMDIPVPLNCKGGFYAEYRSIIIHDLQSRTMSEHIIFHEIGHYVFHTVIGSYLRKEWTTKLFPQRNFITDYARLNPHEDFAESYAVYMCEPERLARIPAKFQFMKNRVFTIV